MTEDKKISKSKTTENDSSKQESIHLLYEFLKKTNHTFTSQTKTRSDVIGSGKKLYKQKGTGRARPGTCKSPLKRGGGKSFGAVLRSPRISMNKKQKQLSFSVLFKSLKSKITLIDIKKYSSLKKTKELIQELAIKENEKYYYIYSKEPNILLNNINKITQTSLSSINILDCLNSKVVFIEQDVKERMKELKYVK